MRTEALCHGGCTRLSWSRWRCCLLVEPGLRIRAYIAAVKLWKRFWRVYPPINCNTVSGASCLPVYPASRPAEFTACTETKASIPWDLENTDLRGSRGLCSIGFGIQRSKRKRSAPKVCRGYAEGRGISPYVSGFIRTAALKRRVERPLGDGLWLGCCASSHILHICSFYSSLLVESTTSVIVGGSTAHVCKRCAAEWAGLFGTIRKCIYYPFQNSL